MSTHPKLEPPPRIYTPFFKPWRSLLLLVVLSYVWRNKSNKNIYVDIDGAVIKGHTIEVRRSRIASFTGIPYAQSPLGHLRFAKPNKRRYTKGEEIDCTLIPPACLQNEYDPAPPFLSHIPHLSEDCLFLNIFTKLSWIKANKKKPVLFYIHGGSFSNGDGISRDGTGLVDQEDIILVSVNYRLQMLGFMNYGADVPPNIGMWDVVVALQWVQDYIHLFGGDRDKVTIMGESAGGAVVTYLHTSPLTEHLFARSIALSGTMLAPWAFTTSTADEQAAKWKLLLQVTGCKDNVLNCLRKASQAEILGAMSSVHEVDPTDTWPPIKDGILVTDHPLTVLSRGNFSKRPLLSGICQDEGLTPTIAFGLMNEISLNSISDRLTSIPDMKLLSVHNRHTVIPCLSDNGDALIQFYTEGKESDLKEPLKRLIGDWLLFCPQLLTTELVGNAGSAAYQYVFDFLSKNLSEDPSSWNGVKHGDDLAYVFGLPFSTSSLYSNPSFVDKWGPKDRKISRLMMALVGGFTKKGAPFAGHDGFCWKNQDKYLYLDRNAAVLKNVGEILSHCRKMMDIVNSRTVPCS